MSAGIPVSWDSGKGLEMRFPDSSIYGLHV